MLSLQNVGIQKLRAARKIFKNLGQVALACANCEQVSAEVFLYWRESSDYIDDLCGNYKIHYEESYDINKDSGAGRACIIKGREHSDLCYSSAKRVST